MLFLDKFLLFPYYLVLKIRNKLYDSGRWKSYSFDVPIISVGNVTVGGTGKTPHVEMLIRFLQNQYRIAVVSRGYKRKTKGYGEVSISDNYKDVGDEPLQIKKKFPEIKVVVDSSRKRAIENLLNLPEEQKPTLVILDDAFQHRKVRPDISILLVDYSRPIFEDHLLPIGGLRDLPTEIRRADIVIVTKVPDEIDISDREKWRKRLHLLPSQPLFFSKISYLTPLPIFPDKSNNRYIYSKNAILFSGIANDTSLRNNLVGTYKLNSVLRFSDHHNYTPEDFRTIETASRKHPTAVIITTEKDSQRITGHYSVSDELKSKLFYLPIQSDIIPEIDPSERVIPEEMDEIGEAQFKKHIIFVANY